MSNIFGLITLPLPFALWPVPYALAFWGIYFWTRRGERKVLLRVSSPQAKQPEADRGSWAVIDKGSRAARLAAVAVAFLTPPVEGPGRIGLYVAGLLLMVSGTLLRRYCFHLLGRHFTFRVTVSRTQEIVQDGIYRWVRHPSYTGGILYNVGIGCALTNWGSILILALGMMLVYVYRVRVEEKALLAAHGEAYGEYMRHTKRFIPFLL